MKRLLSILLVIFAAAFVGSAHGDVLLDEGFEDSISLPSGWTQTQLSGSATWNIQTGGWTGGTWPATAHSGVHNATLSKASTNYNETRLISPVFWTASRTGISLTFWHYQAVWTGLYGGTYNGQDELKVLYSSDGGTNWSQLAYYNSSVTAWTLRTLSLPTPSPSSRIAFEGNAKYGIGLSIDDIKVTGNAATEVSVVATDPSASEEGPDAGIFTISRSGVTNAGLTVNFVMSGTATEASDYTLSHSGQVTFAPGQASVQVTLTPVDDQVKDEFDLDNDAAETAILTISSDPQYYGIGTGSSTVNIRDNDLSSLQVLIIGSTHDSSERLGGTSAAFSPTAMATQLAIILDAASSSNANVVTIERYDTAVSVLSQAQYAYNLESWFHWPYPAGAESSRWANLRGEAGIQWDYVILIPDPYTIEKMPGLYALGVANIAEEVAKGAGETILLMPWPNGSGSSVAHYEEMVYRAGRSGGYKVVPAGLAWDAQGQPTGNDAAYLAAATIYSEIYGLNAHDTGYSYSTTLANRALTTVNANAGAKPYTGDITFQNPFLFNKDTKRKIYWSSHGSSTEAGFNAKIGPAIARCKVGYESYTPWNRSWTDWTNSGGDTYWTEWSPSWPTPIAWNLGRDPVTSEPFKGYLINPTYWDFAFPFYYQWSTWGEKVEDANDHFIGQMFGNDYDMAKRMITEGNSGRGLPLRTLWAQFHKEYPLERPLRDGSGPHLNYYEDEAVATYMYTLYSGRCPLDTPPAVPEADLNWMARKIGYETAWRLGRCQARAPGFKVMPTAWNASNVTPTVSQTLSVQFMLVPTSDVTVAISSDDNYAGRATPSILTFTPENYSDAQTVTVSGVTGSAGAHPFNITVTTASDDEVYEGLSDTWDFVNTRSAGVSPSDIRVLGNGAVINSGDLTPAFADGTDFGVATSSVSRSFIMENMSSSVTVNLTNSPKRVTLSDPSGYFTVSPDAAATLNSGSTTTFGITYTPVAAGTHTALVTIASTDVSIPVYTFAVKGERATSPLVGNPTASSSGFGAKFAGTLTGGGLADAWVCWGDNDGGTTSTSGWGNVVSMGSVKQGEQFSAAAEDLLYGVIYECRMYVSNPFGSAWSGLTTFSLSRPEVAQALNWDFETGDLQGWTNVGTTAGTDTVFRDGHEPVNTVYAFKQGTYWINTYISNEGTSDAWTGIIETESTIVLGAGAHLTMLLGGGGFAWSGTPDAPGALAGIALQREVSPGTWENILWQTGGAGTGGTDLKSHDHDLSSYEGETVRLRIYDTTTAGYGWTAVDDITLTVASEGATLGVSNTAALNVLTNSANVTGVLDAGDSVFSVYLYCSPNSNSTASAWASDGLAQSVLVGTYTNVTGQSLAQPVSSLSAGKTYYFTFMAMNEVTNIWPSENLQFTTMGTAAVAAPTALSASAISTSRIDLAWVDNSGNETGFLVERSTTNGAGFAVIGSAAQNATIYSDATVSPGATYYYRLTATNATDSSSTILASATTPKIPTTVILSALSQTYDGSAKTVIVTTEPAGISVDVTYDGGSIAPSNVGVYAVVATVNQTGFEGSTNGTLQIISGAPMVVNAGATPENATSATLSGELTDGGMAETWICWGNSDPGTGSTGDWDNVISIGPVIESTPFSTVVNTLATNETYWYRCYVSNAADTAWSAEAESFSGSPAGAGLASVPVTSGLIAHWDASDISGISEGAQVSAWSNSVNPAAYNLSLGGGSPTYRASVAEFNGKPAVEFASTGTDWFQFTKISTIRTVFWVLHDAYIKTGEQFLLADDTSYDFHSNVDKIWGSFASANIRNGTTEVNGLAVDGTLVNRPTEAAIISVVTAGDVMASRLSHDRTYGGRSWDGKIAEILIYDTPLTTEEEDAVGSYLAAKYGLTTIYPEVAGAAVVNLAPTNVTGTQAALNASLNAVGTNYDVYVYYGTNNGGTNASSWVTSVLVGSYSDVSTNVSYPATLGSGQPWFYTFMASNTEDIVWASPSWKLTMSGVGSSVAAPTGLAATPASTSQVNLAWTDNANETGFLIERSVTNNSNFIEYDTAAANAESYSDTTVTPGLIYYYRLTATNAADRSAVSGEASATVLKMPATITLSDTNQVYDGTALSVTTVTDPVGLTVGVTYNGSGSSPVNAGTYAVTASVNEVSFEGWTNGTLTVAKATPTVSTWPTASAIEEGQALSSSALSSGSASTAGSFGFESPSTTPPLGTNTVNVIFVATDSSNYNEVTGTVDVAVTVPPPVGVNNSTGAVSVTETSARLSGEMTSGTSGTAWICWGDNDPGTGSTGDWDNVVSIGQVTQSTPFSTVVNTLATNETYWYRCYVSSAADTAWSTEAESFSGTPAGGGATWTPAELALTAWYDAADTGTILTNDAVDRVSQWSDKSGNGRHATNTTTTAQPAYEPYGFRNLPTVSCVAAGDWLNFELPTPSTQVVFVVTGVSSSTYVNVFVSSGGTMIPMSQNGNVGAPFRIIGVGDIGTAQGLDLFVNGDTNAVTSTKGGMYGALVQSNTNGVLAKFADVPLLTATAFNQMGGNISSWLARNRYSEIVVVDASTQIEDQQRIEGYLAHKWGMVDDLHVDHPYRYTVPGGAARIENRAATSIAETSTVLNAALNSPGTNSDVYVHWGTSDGGSNPVAWASTAYIDAYSDIITNVSYSLGGLIRGQTYFYTFSASNGAGYVWASPSWYFTPPAGAVLTTNHLIPHVWLDTVLTNTISDYEAEVDDDPDGDGFSTWAEYWSGTNPDDSNSCLKIDAITYDGTNVQIEWASDTVDPGIPPMWIEATSNLVSATWSKVGKKNLSTGGNSWSTNALQKLFYRLRVQDLP